MVRVQGSPPKVLKSKSGGIGRRAGFRFQFPKGNGGSSPFSCTTFCKGVPMKQPQLYSNPSRAQFISIEPDDNPIQRHVHVTIPQSFVTTVYNQALLAQQHQAQPYGLHQKEVSLSYVENIFHSHILEQVHEFLFKFFVINVLYGELRNQRIPIAGSPRLLSIDTDSSGDTIFRFSATMFTLSEILEWKYFAFKAPKRKRYKDLDRQVKLFLEEEEHNQEKYHHKSINYDDWVNFNLSLVDQDNNILLDNYSENLWLKIGTEESDAAFQELFLGKQVGDVLFTRNEGLQDFFNELTGSNFNFMVTIEDIIPSAYVNIEHLKRQFRIKTNRDLHQKIIEVFSYRNDISQRKATVDESLKLMLTKHPFSAPHFLVLRQQEELLNAMHTNPDYLVYKMQKDFKKNIESLAERQVKEHILADQVAYNERLDMSNEDVKNYLNLTNRQRLREFIHFRIPPTKVRGQEQPIVTQELMQTCLREKTLNLIIFHFTKK